MSKTIADLNAFVEDFESQKIQVVVEEPETVKEKGMFGSSEYTTFLIMTKKFGKDPVGVRHRFSEFDTFRSAARSRFGPLGILVPQMPAKRVLGKGEQNFVIERMYGLGLFCQAFVENPFLAVDQGWAQFTYPSDYAPGIENPGEAWLRGALEHLGVPDNARERMTSLEEETTVVEYYSKACFEKFKAVQTSLKAHNASMDALNTELTKWATEEDYLIAFGGRGIDTLGVRLPENEKPIKTVTSLKDYYERSTRVATKDQVYVGIFECAIMEHIIGLIEGMKELFKSHGTIIGEIDSLKNKIYKLNLTKTPTPKTDAQIMEAKSSLATKEASLAGWYKAFFHFSLPLFARRRAALLKQLAVTSASYNLTQAKEQEKNARRFIEDIKYSSLAGVGATSAILTKLGVEDVCPLPHGYDDVKGDSSTPLPPFSGLFKRAVEPGCASELDKAAETASLEPAKDVFSWSKNPLKEAGLDGEEAEGETEKFV